MGSHHAIAGDGHILHMATESQFMNLAASYMLPEDNLLSLEQKSKILGEIEPSRVLGS